MPNSARGWRAFCAVMLAAVSIPCAVLPARAIDAIAEAYLQQGKRSYDRWDYAAAARLFNKAARDAENTYNNKLYVAAIYHNAAQAYSKLADVNGSYTDIKDDDLTVKFLQSRLRDFGDPEEFGHDKVNVDETDLELQGRKLINRSKPMAGSAESRMKMQWIAVHYLRLALEIKETAAGAGSVEVANSMEALALLYEKSNARLDEAEALMRKALAIKEAALGKTSAELAITLYNLGMVMKTSAAGHDDQGAREGKLREAVDCYKRALSVLGANKLGKSRLAGKCYADLSIIHWGPALRDWKASCAEFASAYDIFALDSAHRSDFAAFRQSHSLIAANAAEMAVQTFLAAKNKKGVTAAQLAALKQKAKAAASRAGLM